MVGIKMSNSSLTVRHICFHCSQYRWLWGWLSLPHMNQLAVAVNRNHRRGALSGVCSWMCSPAINHSKLLLCQAVLVLSFPCLQCCHGSQGLLQIRTLAACLWIQISAPSHSVSWSIPFCPCHTPDTSQSCKELTPLIASLLCDNGKISSETV